MKRGYQTNLIVVAVFSVIIGFIISAVAIKGPSKNVNVTKVAPIPNSFPDVKNDPTYSSFLNSSAIDPAQAVQVGGSGNTSPFNGEQ